MFAEIKNSSILHHLMDACRHLLPKALKSSAYDWVAISSPEAATVFLEAWNEAGKPNVRKSKILARTWMETDISITSTEFDDHGRLHHSTMWCISLRMSFTRLHQQAFSCALDSQLHYVCALNALFSRILTLCFLGSHSSCGIRDWGGAECSRHGA
jgi:hypothetical protein